jgi:hypothetical protein
LAPPGEPEVTVLMPAQTVSGEMQQNPGRGRPKICGSVPMQTERDNLSTKLERAA